MREAHANVGDLFAAFLAPVLQRDIGAHFLQRRQQPAAQRIGHDAFDDEVRPLDDQRGDERKSGR